MAHFIRPKIRTIQNNVIHLCMKSIIAFIACIAITAHSFGQLAVYKNATVEKITSIKRGFSEVAYLEKSDTSYTVHYYADCSAHLHIKSKTELIALCDLIKFDRPRYELQIELDGEPVAISVHPHYVALSNFSGVMTFSEKEFKKLFSSI